WRTASAVTAQVLTTTVSRRPARAASRRITSDSAALSLQPKVTTSTPVGLEDVGLEEMGLEDMGLEDMGLHSAGRGKQRGIEPAAMFVFDRAGHQHMVVALAPFDGKVAARQRDGHLAPAAREPRGGDGCGAGRRPAGLGEAGAALPGTDDDAIARRRCGERD